MKETDAHLTVHSERLIYREFDHADRNHLSYFKENSSQLKYMHFSICTDDEIDSFLDMATGEIGLPGRSQWHFAVEEKGKNDFIGSVALMTEKDSPVSAEIGYWFKKEYWGKGFATEAAQAMIDFGFDKIGFHRIWGKTHVDNQGSAKVMEHCGMVREGILREHIWLQDHYRSSIVYSILENEYHVRS
jgi:ribosomal-protein-alanine N-acetyltransferase